MTYWSTAREIALFIHNMIDGLAKIVIGVASIFAALFIVMLLASSAPNRNIIIDQITVPENMSTKGLTGDVLTLLLRDKINYFIKQTNSARTDPGLSFKKEAPTVEIPNTGFSLDLVRSYIWKNVSNRKDHIVSGAVFELEKEVNIKFWVDKSIIYSKVLASADEIESVMSDVVQAVIERAEPYFLAVKLYREDSQYSLDLLDKALSQNPDIDDKLWIYNLKFSILWNSGKFGYNNYSQMGDAIGCLEEAYRLDRTFPTTFLNAGYAISYFAQFLEDKEKKKFYNLSYEYYQKALAGDPGMARAHYNLHVLYGRIDQGRFKEKILDELKAAVRLNPSDPKYRTELAGLYFEKGNQENLSLASDIYRDLLRENISQSEIYDQLIIVNEKLDIQAAGLSFFKAIAEKNPNSVAASNGYASALISNRKYEDAVTAYRRSIEIDRSSLPARIGLAYALQRAARPIEAIAEYSKLLDDEDLVTTGPDTEDLIATVASRAGSISDELKLKANAKLIMMRAHRSRVRGFSMTSETMEQNLRKLENFR